MTEYISVIVRLSDSQLNKLIAKNQLNLVIIKYY